MTPAKRLEILQGMKDRGLYGKAGLPSIFEIDIAIIQTEEELEAAIQRDAVEAMERELALPA